MDYTELLYSIQRDILLIDSREFRLRFFYLMHFEKNSKIISKMKRDPRETLELEERNHLNN